MVRRARVLVTRLTVRIAERPDNISLESRSRAVIGHSITWRKAPWIIRELLSGCRLDQGITCQRPSEKCAAVKQSVAGNGFQISHGCPPHVTSVCRVV